MTEYDKLSIREFFLQFNIKMAVVTRFPLQSFSLYATVRKNAGVVFNDSQLYQPAVLDVCGVPKHVVPFNVCAQKVTCVILSTAEVKRDHCNKTVDIYEDVSSPEVTPENIGKPMTCWYRFRSFRGTPRDWILRIRFKKFKVGTLVNATHCHMGYMQVSVTACLTDFIA
jgi:hypothetical protein